MSEHDDSRSWQQTASAARAEQSKPAQVVTLDEISHDRDVRWCSKPDGARTRTTINPQARLFGAAAAQAARNASEYASLDRKARAAEALKAKRDAELAKKAKKTTPKTRP